LDIKQGDRIGIIGRNGAGKSNFFKKIKLHCMTEPTCGKIFIKFIKGRVASLLKVGICLDSELTSRDNIELKQFRMVVLCTQTEEITENIIQKIQDLPLKNQQQILDYIEFIANKYQPEKVDPTQKNQKRIAGLQGEKIWMSDDFNKPLGDEIWASDTVIHEFQLSPDFPIAKYERKIQ